MTPRPPVHSSYAEYRPPAPVGGCEACRELAARRSAVKAAFDYSAVSDANVRLRAHLLEAHDT
ncbi:hypothetical protein [Streptomyces sp. NBC_00576]|uniref:hypothetical protein n=1 Tax=Streptomyces sp. NBC_00576 TaxID=2903665 RepID=UPI002E7FD8FE|nr:hypothetical protein [Streptomyces sp. NBC_00576]WUB71777.1 hypothetical protein OG734_17650 [Streptomyces sp. NBC_00576]